MANINKRGEKAMSDETREKINRYLINETEFLKVKDKMNEDQLRVFVDQAIRDFCHDHHVEMDAEYRMTLIRNLVSGVMSLGPLRPLMEDDSITEVMIALLIFSIVGE